MAMAKIEFEHDVDEEILDLVSRIDGDRVVTQIKSRVGTVKLTDRRTAQIHLTVTTDRDEFIARPRSK